MSTYHLAGLTTYPFLLPGLGPFFHSLSIYEDPLKFKTQRIALFFIITKIILVVPIDVYVIKIVLYLPSFENNKQYLYFNACI
jgi:hypothetical protein